jgi:hypothetical protein
MKGIKYSIIILLILMGSISCEHFDELNTNPNAPASVTPELLVTQFQKDAHRFWNPNPTDYATGNLWTKHVVKLETNPNPYQYYYSYSPYGGFGTLQRIPTFDKIVEFAKGNPTESSFRGLTLFYRAWGGFGMTIEMGDIPYSEAGKGAEGLTKPKYDKQVDVFKQVLDDLKKAEAYFATGIKFGGDFMYNGDPVKWRRLCNFAQLKILNALTKKITPEQKARFAEIVAAGNLLTEADAFQLVYTDDTNASHPFYNGENQRIITALSNLVVDYLKLTKDRRLFYFAEPAGSQIAAGLKENDFEAYVGAPTEISSEQLALNRTKNLYSLMNKRYVALRSGDPMLGPNYSDQCFIIAEAIEEGWLPGSAKTYYENGVKAILKYYMTLPSAQSTYLHGMAITQSYIDSYFTGEAAYKVSGTKDDRIKQIITQRWLLEFFQAGGYSYRTFLRTGYPAFPLNPATSLNPDDVKVYPKRWKYPTRELTSNTENYNKAVQEQFDGYDGINKVPWWLK